MSAFRLDKYEVTVGRFRSFVGAVVGGWRPAPGAGKHPHLNGGQGLVDDDPDASATYEAGWAPSWSPDLAATTAGWNTNLSCGAGVQTWTPTAGADEALPVNCVTWFEAYAFCIYDGGFLPSEAEWNFAAAAGAEQRVYPWSGPPDSGTIDCTYANYGGASPPATCCVLPGTGGANSVGSESPKGDGKWGHADMAGNVFEWTLDVSSSYVTPCTDCAFLTGATNRAVRGGGFGNQPIAQLAASRGVSPPGRRANAGIRCARQP